jgi:uncharacterized protein (TIGR02246 family)
MAAGLTADSSSRFFTDGNLDRLPSPRPPEEARFPRRIRTWEEFMGFTDRGPLAACLVLSLTLAAAAADAPTGIDRLMATQDIQALSISYGYDLDFMDADGLANLFAEDGIWENSAKPLAGRQAIHDYWAAQAGRPYVTRHSITNTRVEFTDSDLARGTAYLQMYRFDPKHPEAIKSLEPVLLGLFHDEYVRTPDGWRFKLRHLDTTSVAK